VNKIIRRTLQGIVLAEIPSEKTCYAVWLSPNCRILAAAGGAQSITVWSLPEVELMHAWNAPGRICALWGTSNILASAGSDRTVTIRSLDTVRYNEYRVVCSLTIMLVSFPQLLMKCACARQTGCYYLRMHHRWTGIQFMGTIQWADTCLCQPRKPDGKEPHVGITADKQNMSFGVDVRRCKDSVRQKLRTKSLVRITNL
jgi:hypothetical protein